MALKRATSYVVGDEVRLVGTEGLLVTTPGGARIPISARGTSVRFLATEPGQWSYEWADGQTGEFEVVQAQLEEIPVENLPTSAMSSKGV